MTAASHPIEKPTNQTEAVPFGESLIDHDEGFYDDLRVEIDEGYVFPVAPDELHQLIEASVARDIAADTLTYPPDPEQTLRLATEFYETYLYDTGLDKVEVIDRYIVGLIEALEAQHGDNFTYEEPVVVQLFDKVHALEEAELAAA